MKIKLYKKEDIIKKIENYIEINGDSLDNEIQNLVDEFLIKKIKRTEEDFKIKFISILDRISKEIGIKLDPLYENTVYKGRIDALYNLVNLEYKAPGKLESSNKVLPKKSKNHLYIEEVKRQILGYSKSNKVELSSILGIIFDGSFFIYVNCLDSGWYISEPEPRNKNSLRKFLKRLFSLQIDKAVTINNLIKDFGFKSVLAEQTIKLFYNKIENNIKNHQGLMLIFEQWKALFREVSGYSYESVKLNLQEIKEAYSLNNENVKIDYLIFAIHTYYALLIKILAVEILFYHKKNYVYQHALKFENEKLAFNTLKKIESGDRFKELGIKNFLEEDFFSWYLEIWDYEIYKISSEILSKFDEYNYNTVNLDERNSRDLLKKLYNYLLPKTLRHALGEYYSPDWIAERTYNLLEIPKDEIKSILDPTCGSGTFIVIAIKKIIENCSIEREKLLKIILENIHGFDLNPLAVISARTNYIIALGDLIDSTHEEIEIPIYHCDAMLTILEQPKGENIVKKLSTRAGIYEIPIEFIHDKQDFYEVLDVFSRFLDKNEVFNERVWGEIKKIYNNFDKINPFKLKNIKELTNTLYSQIKMLDDKGIRKIWIQIIKNSFAPIFHKKVDYIVGNPPWINWQTLPEDYRESIHKHWYDYKIFDFKGIKARLGSAHDDISVLLTYVVMDNLLKDKGKLGFIINQNLLQAYGGGEGFRKFKIKGETPVKVNLVEDYVEVEPFKALGASNKTAIIIMTKGIENTYPVIYKKWTRLNKGIIDCDDLLESVFLKLGVEELIAEPLQKNEYQNTPWLISDITKIEKIKKLIGKSPYIARKGIDTSANGIYWINIEGEVRNKFYIKNTPENSRKDIPSITSIMEKDLIYPLVRGRDIRKWYYQTPYHIIVPYEFSLKNVLTIDELRENFPLTYKYFYESSVSSEFIKILKARGIYKKHYTEETPYHVLYNIGEYTSAPYKVIWKALQAKGMNTCVIEKKEDKLVLPDHNNIMVPLYSKEEAYYLCGILNSEIVENFIDSYISWFKSTHILDNINIPKYDNENTLHSELAKKSIKAHEIANRIYDKKEIVLKENLIKLEKEINDLVLKILS